MLIFSAIKELFSPPTLEEQINRKLKESITMQEQCKHVIRMHEFQLHMTKCEQAALNSWINKEKDILYEQL